MATKIKRPLLFCNSVGGNDELIFDGNSIAFNANGELIAQARRFEEDFIIVDSDSSNPLEYKTNCAEQESIF